MTALAIARPIDLAEPRAAADADPAMVRGCQAGDPGAFRRFVLLHQDLVLAFLSRVLGAGGAGSATEDLAQDVFLRAYRAFPSYDPSRGARLSTWLLTIARNAALDARKRRRLPEAPLDEESLASPSLDPERLREQAELGQAIALAAERLSLEQREVFVLAEFHGLPMDEIAQVVGAPTNTVKARLFRARERLRELLSAWGGP